MGLRGLDERVVIVTGGASGIGRATAARLLAEGASVAVVDANASALARVVDELGPHGALGVVADVSVEADVERAFNQTIARFGRVDGLFNNAGVAPEPRSLVGVESEDFARVLAVNVLGVFHGIRAMLAHLSERAAPGAIVNTSSGLGLRGVVGQGPYAATKAAVISLTKTAAREAGGAGVRVNALLPGPTETPMYMAVPADMREEYARLMPLGRMGQPSEQAAMVAWLLSDESSFATGAVFLVDGGEGA